LGKKGFQTIPTVIIGIEITCGYLSALYRYFWSFSPHASYHWLYTNNQRECCSPGVGKRC